MSRLLFTCAVASLAVACGGSNDNTLFRDPDAQLGEDASGADGSSESGGSESGGSETSVTDGAPADVATGPCTAGETGKEACGKCGSRIRVCNSDRTWSSWSTCSGETGVCTPNQMETQACGDGTNKKRTCTATCTWGAFGACEGVVPCTSGATESEACGTCGKRVRVCSSMMWSDWSACTEEPGCSPTGDELWLLTVPSGLEQAVAVTIDRLRISDHTSAGTIAIRTTASGAQQPLTLYGASGSDGQLSRSADGKYVTLGGYAAAVGVPNVSTESDAARVFARIDAARTVDTTTTATNMPKKTLYGVTSANGSAFWGVGDAVQYIPYGAPTTATLVLTSTATTVSVLDSVLHIGGGDLATVTTPKAFVAKLSPALPTTTATATNIIETTGTLFSQIDYPAFVGLARAATTMDTIYVSGNTAIEVWIRAGTAWTKSKSFALGVGNEENARYLTAFVQGTSVIVYATAKTTTTSRLIKCVDTGGTTTPTCTSVRTSTGTVRFKGVALAPK